MLLRLYNEDTPLMDRSKERFRNENARIKQDLDDAPIKLVQDDTSIKSDMHDLPIGGELNGVEVLVANADTDEDLDEGGGVRLREGSSKLSAEETADVEDQAAAEIDIALGARDEEDAGMDGGVELG